MNKNLLAIGIPSNRNLAGSETAVRSAAAFCRQAAAQLVVSDNSGEVKKEEELAASLRAESLRYIKMPPCSMIENSLQAFNATEAEFVLMMGDDDRLFRFGESADFGNLPADVVAIKPCVFAYADPHGILTMNASPLPETGARERIVENLRTSSGTNLGIFSFWRRDVLKSLMELCCLHHPTKGTYCDWSLMNGLVSSGKVVVDPSTCYFYNIQNWGGDASAIAAQAERAFVVSGLPAGSSAYAYLFHAVDSYIFINRKDSPLPAQERDLTALFCLNLHLKNYAANTPRQSGHENAEEIAQLSDRLAAAVVADNVPAIFALLAEILNVVRPNLGQQYKDFHHYAVGRAWGKLS
jgi:hypothetical protein